MDILVVEKKMKGWVRGDEMCEVPDVEKNAELNHISGEIVHCNLV